MDGIIDRRPYGQAEGNSARFELTEDRRRYMAGVIGNIAVELLGKPVSRTSTELRFQNRKLVVNIAGRRAGKWHVFGSEEHGDTLALIQYLTGCDFKTAIEYVFGSRTTAPVLRVANPVPVAVEHDTSEFARQTWAEGVAAKGTVAELYLLNRGVPAPAVKALADAGVIKFHAAHRSGPEAKHKAQALLLAATDLSGQVHAVQAVRVDANGRKVAGEWVDGDGEVHEIQAKLSCGLMKENGAAGWISRGTGDVIVAEGPEDAISLYAARPDAMVGATFGSMLRIVDAVPSGRRIILAAQNDDPNSDAATGFRKAVAMLLENGHGVWIARPPAGIKDANDLLRAHGIEAVRAMLDNAQMEPATVPFEETRTGTDLVREDADMPYDFHQVIAELNREDRGDAWEPPSQKEPEKVEPQTFPLMALPEMFDLPKPTWRIKKVLPEKGIGILFGASGAKKSFAAVDWCCHIAHGMDWQGNRVKQTGVVYVASEDAAGITSQRVPGWHLWHGLQHSNPALRVVPCPVDLTDAEQVDRLLATIRKAVADCGFDVGMVVIDTLARSMSGDENSGEVMGKFIAACTAIQREINGLVLIVHHSGWGDTSRTRGHSSLWAATDARFMVESDKGSRNVVLTVAHLKNGQSGDDYALHASTVELGTDEDGDPITTLVLTSQENTQPQGGVPKLTEKEKIVLSVLQKSECTGIAYGVWWEGCRKAGIGSKTTFSGALNTLKRDGFCRQAEDGRFVLNTTNG